MVPFKLSHYRVEEQIGAGGMGVVYRAHDEQLERDVAIKILPAGALADEDARKRFRKEALSLAKLNHPNIATVHEFGTENNTDFLVTEYIAGVTLDSRLVSGALPVDEVLGLGIQLADGLSAAHERGIVHRDVKPANLRLTSDGRLKILDFGLAQLSAHASESTATTLDTASNEITGTLPYMAPEQIQGEKANASGDIWSAGAVLYEMATGKRPFPQKNASQLITAILNDSPEPPNKVNPEISAELDRVILKALAKNPKVRYRSARELARDLGQPPTAQLLTVRTRRSRSRTGVAAGIAAAALVLIAASIFFVRRARHDAPLSSLMRHHQTVAVLGFKNLSGDTTNAWLSTALSEMLTTDLSEGGQLRTVPGESVAQMKISLALPEADSFSPKTLGRIRRNLGSDDVVVGSYVALGSGNLRLDLRLQDTKTGETIAAVSEEGSATRIDDLVSKAGAELRAKLGVAPLSEAQSAQVRTTLPDDPDAARLYSEGLQDLRLFNSLAAKDQLEKAVSLKPDYAPAHAALASAWFSLGYDDKAKQQAEKALDLSSTASSEERIQIVGRSHEILQQWPEAEENYQALWGFFPDRADYGLSLARAQMGGGQIKEAEKTLAQLRTLTASEADAARIDLLDAQIGGAQGDFKREQSMAEQAMEQGQSIGASLLVARTLIYQCDAWERMGHPEKASPLCMQAKDLYDLAGNRGAAASALQVLGDNLFDQGQYRAARKDFEAALAVFREIGAQRDIRDSNERIGNVLYNQGRPLESEVYYKRALQYDQEIYSLDALASDYGNIANALDELGDLKGELTLQQKSLAAFNKVGNKRGACETLYNLGNLSLETGDLSEAKKYFDQALSSAIQLSYRMAQPQPMAGLGDILEAQGDLNGARNQYSQALTLAQEEKLESFATAVRLSMAVAALDEGKYSEGETLSRQVVDSFDKNGGDSNSGAAAWAILSQNLTGEGKLTEARAAADKALVSSRQGVGSVSHFEPNLADSLVKAKTGRVEEARQELEATLIETQKYGYQYYEYEIRLALCEIEMPSDAAAAHADLAKLETDAKSHGFLLMAGKAHRLAQHN
jgi:serine/threonine protein kinase/tetratricopeptide (TPR) repeat protein